MTPKGVQILPYLEAREKYPHVFPQNQQDPPLAVLTDPTDIEACVEATGVEPFMLVGPYSSYIIHPIRRRNGSFGTFHQALFRSELEKRAGMALFPIWTDSSGTKRVLLTVHHRIPIAHLPLEYGGGWMLDLPAFARRAGKTAQQSIEEEAFAEGNVRLIGPPERVNPDTGFAPLPGILSQVAEFWTAPIEPLEGEPLEQMEGIEGRVFWTKEEFQHGLRKGVVKMRGRKLLTTSANNFVGYVLAEFHGIW